jgi:hypothetical protein
MTIPRKYNRRIVVDGEAYLWYLRGNDAWRDAKHIAIRHSQHVSGQLLLLDFNAYEFEIRPKMIRSAIEFAQTNGWTPTTKANPLYIGFDNVRFIVLPPGEHYVRVFQHPPSVTWLKPTPETLIEGE